MADTPRKTHRDLLPKDACPSLVFKHLLTGDLDAPVYDDREMPGDGYFWCAHTCEPVGPDDGFADTRVCRPGRDCYDGVVSAE